MIYSRKLARGDFGGASHWISATAWQMHPLMAGYKGKPKKLAAPSGVANELIS